MVAEERPPPAEEPPAEEPPQEEDDVVDPKEKLERLCRASAPCAGLLARYEECAARVRSRPGTSETCTEEFLDLAPCIDDCVRRLYCTPPHARLTPSRNRLPSISSSSSRDAAIKCSVDFGPSLLPSAVLCLPAQRASAPRTMPRGEDCTMPLAEDSLGAQETPKEWASVHLRKVKEHAPRAEEARDAAPPADACAVRLKSAPKPADYAGGCAIAEGAADEKRQTGAEQYDEVRSRLRKSSLQM